MAEWTPREPYPRMPEAAEGDDYESFILESDTRAFDRTLTVRQKLMRGGLAFAVVVVTTFFVLGGPDAAGAFVQGLRQQQNVVGASARPVRLPLVSLPVPGMAQTVPTLRISPAAGNHGDAYACWADPGPTDRDGIVQAGTLHTAALASNRSLWISLEPPTAKGTRCALTADTVRETWLAMSVYTTSDPHAGCILPKLFLSEASGKTWAPVSWPNAWITACNVRLALTDGQLYVTADDPLLIRNALEVGAAERMMTTDDGGATWQVADAGLPLAASVRLIDVRPGGHLLAQTTDGSPQAAGMLWQSATNGAGWESLGLLPGAGPQVYASSDPTATGHGGWGRLYVIAQTVTQGVPDGPNRLLMASAFPGGRWTSVPLPASEADGSGVADYGISGALVGPGDTLAILQVAPSQGRREFTPPDYLWMWSPERRAWQQALFLIPPNSIAQGATWGDGVMRIWMTRINLGLPPSVQIVTFTLTASSAG